MIDMIGVPVDGSRFGELALPFALELTHRLNCKLLLLYTPDFWEHPLNRSSESAAYEVGNYLAELQKTLTAPATPDRLPPERILTRQISLTSPVPAADFTPLAGNLLIVMPSSNHFDLFHQLQFHLLQVNQVQKSLGLGIIPLVLLKPGEHELNAAKKLTLPERLKLSAIKVDAAGKDLNLLVALDGSQEAENILYPVIALARQTGATIYLLRVYFKLWDEEYDGQLLNDDAFYGSDIWKENSLRQSQAYCYLEHLKAWLTGQGCKVVVAIRGGETIEQILEYAREINPTMIALTCRSRNKIGRLVIGSVPDTVLNYCNSPVLLVDTTLETKVMLAAQFGDDSPLAAYRETESLAAALLK